MVEYLALVDLSKSLCLFSDPCDETRRHLVLFKRVSIPFARVSNQSKHDKRELVDVCDAVTLKR